MEIAFGKEVAPQHYHDLAALGLHLEMEFPELPKELDLMMQVLRTQMTRKNTTVVEPLLEAIGEMYKSSLE